MSKSTNHKEHLLDYITKHTTCMYMSDLHNIKHFQEIENIVKTIDPSTYPLNQWTDTSHYITGYTKTFTNTQEVKKHILNFLQEKLEDYIY